MASNTSNQSNGNDTVGNNQTCCTNPIDIFAVAAAISLLFYQELSLCQLTTLANLITLIDANLDAFIAQMIINKGSEEIVQPPIIDRRI